MKIRSQMEKYKRALMFETKLIVVYGIKRLHIFIECENCNNSFWKQKKEYNRKSHHFCCAKCNYEFKRKNGNVLVSCGLCNKKFLLKKSRLNNKSKIYFCCRQHKDKAQRLTGIKEIHPSHYSKDGNYCSYRKNALEHYDNKCSECGEDDFDVLEVHHKDGNRKNNKLENLEILCANCHTKIGKKKIPVLTASTIT